MFVDCKYCCVYFFTLQPGTDALICAEVDGNVSVDHYKVQGYDQPTKTTPVSTNVCAQRLGKHLLKVNTLFLIIIWLMFVADITRALIG